MSLIGSTLDSSGTELCGCVISIRKAQVRLSVWTSSTVKEEAIAVGQRWKAALELSDKVEIKFTSHADDNKTLYEA